MTTIETQLCEAQDLLHEETKQKLTFSTRLRQIESERDALQEQLDEEEETKKNFEKQIYFNNQQLADVKKK